MSEPITKAVLADPVAVEAVIAEREPRAPVMGSQGQLVAPPTTTEEDDRKTYGQRAINMKWESTQQTIAIGVTCAVLVNCSFLLMFGTSELRQAAFIFLTNIAFLIIGTYFQRTNHTKSSGSAGER